MKNIFKRSSVKFAAISIAICGASLLGYNAYSNATMTPEERLFQQNLDALTNSEEGWNGAQIIKCWKLEDFGEDPSNVPMHVCGELRDGFIFPCGAIIYYEVEGLDSWYSHECGVGL